MPYINCTLQFKHWSVYNLQFLCYSVDKPNLTVDRTHESFFFSLSIQVNPHFQFHFCFQFCTCTLTTDHRSATG